MSLALKGSGKPIISVILVVSVVLFAVAFPVYAQDGTTQANAGPAGIGILILLMGLGALVLVGIVYDTQRRADEMAKSGHSTADEEEE